MRNTKVFSHFFFTIVWVHENKYTVFLAICFWRFSYHFHRCYPLFSIISHPIPYLLLPRPAPLRNVCASIEHDWRFRLRITNFITLMMSTSYRLIPTKCYIFAIDSEYMLATAAFYSYIHETYAYIYSFLIFVCFFFSFFLFYVCVNVCNFNFSNIVRIRQTITSRYLRHYICYIHKIVQLTPKNPKSRWTHMERMREREREAWVRMQLVKIFNDENSSNQVF